MFLNYIWHKKIYSSVGGLQIYAGFLTMFSITNVPWVKPLDYHTLLEQNTLLFISYIHYFFKIAIVHSLKILQISSLY